MKLTDCNLRLIIESDLEQILIWRNSEPIRSNMYNDHLITMEEHIAWYERIKNEENSRHLLFEYKTVPIGVINVTQIDIRNDKCYWGFYLGDPFSSRGCGLAMGFLGLEYIFKTLNIRKLCAEAFAFNQSSLKYHLKLGFTQEGCLRAHILRNNKYEDIICFALFKDDWFSLSDIITQKYFEVGNINE